MENGFGTYSTHVCICHIISIREDHSTYLNTTVLLWGNLSHCSRPARGGRALALRGLVWTRHVQETGQLLCQVKCCGSARLLLVPTLLQVLGQFAQCLHEMQV